MNLRFIGGLGQSAKIPTGGRELWEVWGTGPTSYSQATGDPVIGPAQGEHMSAPCGSVLSKSGNYEVVFQPQATNTLRPGWLARYRFTNIGGGQGVASVTGTGGTGMTVGTVALAFSGGGGTGAAGTLTVLTATTFSVTITNPGSGYTSAPTVTAATGGTPPTLTATLSAPYEEVPTGANLSAEDFQFAAVGGQY